MAQRMAATRSEIGTDNLVDGVPTWMHPSIMAWIKRWTSKRMTIHGTGAHYDTVDRDRILSIERYLRISFQSITDDVNYHQHFLDYSIRDEGHCLDVVEAMLATNNNTAYLINSLNPILIESSSKWIAQPGDVTRLAVLEERLDETSKAAYELAITSQNQISNEMLKKAFSYAFGRHPEATEAYSNSIKAMEAASWPVVIPTNAKATLSDIIRELNTNPSKWASAITEKTNNIGVETITSAMQLVWQGQTNRHGTGTPVVETQNAAEQAVFTSIMVCAWFNRQYVALKV